MRVRVRARTLTPIPRPRRLRDIKDSQAFYAPKTGGQIPDCVPFYDHGGLPADPGASGV